MRSTSPGAAPFDAAGHVRLTYLEEPSREGWSSADLSSAELLAAPGSLLAQRYELEEWVDPGSPGRFWRARQLRSRRSVTVQLLDPAIVEDAVLMEAFLHEASLAAAVEHRHVARVLDYGIDYELEGGVPFLVLEQLTGESLGRRLRQRGRLSLEEVARVIDHAAQGLQALHERGITHRRLDPSHLILSEDYPSGSFRAGTFTSRGELARSGSQQLSQLELDAGGSTSLLFAIDEAFRESLCLVHKLSHQLAGKAHLPGPRLAAERGQVPGASHGPQAAGRRGAEAGSYQSPEQLLGQGTVDARSDLWSLAVIAFEALTGVPAFGGATLGERLVRTCSGEPSAIPGDLALPGGFGAWFRRAVHKLPSERFASATQMSDAFNRLLNG